MKRFSNVLVMLLGVAIVSSLIFGDLFMSYTRNRKSNYISIGDIRITQNDVRLFMKSIPETEKNRYRLALDELINNSIIAEYASEIGFIITKNMITKDIIGIKDFLEDGKFNKKKFRKVMEKNHLSEKEFIDHLKREKLKEIMGWIVGKMVAPSYMAEHLWRVANQEKQVRVFSVEYDKIPVSEKEINEFYKNFSPEFSLPERRASTIALMGKNNLSNISISENEKINFFEKFKHKFLIPSSIDYEQIIFDSRELAIKAKDELSKNNKISMNHIKQKKIYSGSIIESNIILKGVKKSDFDREPEAGIEIFNAPEGELLGPIRISLGWQLVRIVKKYPEKYKNYHDKDVQNYLTGYIRKNKEIEKLNEIAEKIDLDVEKGMSLENISHKYKMQLYHNFGVEHSRSKYSHISEILQDEREDRLRSFEQINVVNFNTENEIDNVVFHTKPNKVSNVIKFYKTSSLDSDSKSDYSIAIIRVDDIIPAGKFDKAKEKKYVKNMLEKYNAMKEYTEALNNIRVCLISDVSNIENKNPTNTKGNQINLKVKQMIKTPESKIHQCIKQYTKGIVEINDIVFKSLQDINGENLNGLSGSSIENYNMFAKNELRGVNLVNMYTGVMLCGERKLCMGYLTDIRYPEKREIDSSQMAQFRNNIQYFYNKLIIDDWLLSQRKRYKIDEQLNNVKWGGDGEL